jgi:hypothetical protein
MFSYETCLPRLVLEAGSFGKKKLKEQGAYIYNLHFFWLHCVFVKASRYIVVYSFLQAASLEEYPYKDTMCCMRRVQDFA